MPSDLGAMAAPVPAAGGFASFDQAPPTGSESPASFNPQMIGDQLAVTQTLAPTTSPASRVTIAPTPGVTSQGNIIFRPNGGGIVFNDQFVFVRLPGATTATAVLLPPHTRALYQPNGNVAVFNVVEVPTERGAVKIAENESPRPIDRVFTTFNEFTRAGDDRIDVYRETVGFEKTFFDGCVSFGMRGPLYQLNGAGVSRSDPGDVVGILKVAVYNDCTSGDVISLGVLAQAPTGSSYVAFNGLDEHGFVVQPFVGYLFNCGYLYLHGFSSAALPTHTGDVLMLYNDVGVGYYTHLGSCDDLLSFVAPTVEVHVNTPLDRRDRAGAVFAQDEINVTGGVHFGFGEHAVLTVAGGTALVGPRLYQAEAAAQLNLRF
jgi:hypothetical protein